MTRHRPSSERGQLDLFRALPGEFAPRDAQDLMAYPFFSLSKTHRVAPIDFAAGNVSIKVDAVPDHGMATIWDADILIWAASQIIEARDAGLRTSRLMAATPYEILNFIGRGVSLRDYQRLKAALDRLQSTTVSTSIRQPAAGRRHRFSWINEWQERTDRYGKPDGIEMIVPDWFYRAVLDDALVLTIDRAYFSLTGGLDRWLYRIVRKHGGRQRSGWRFDFRHLHLKSGSLSPFKRFSFELRDIIRRQPLPGYTLSLEYEIAGRMLLAFEPSALAGQPVDGLVLSGTRTIVPSGTGHSCYREPKPGLTHGRNSQNRPLNLESNPESNSKERGLDVESIARDGKSAFNTATSATKSDTSFRKDGSTAPHTLRMLRLPLAKYPGGTR
ncbi:replication initiator protein A [Mesorhizobium sp. BR1-1-16]|uniref:replication initiator protein A n=1 Tax=Mesorhizobium sp. BR1-1-16 TaxID=2876653 RepID=UPI001CCE56F3|nr:replication initiator protein A [Mesorhizobium sp. BR1-1-16]MBZ9937030.1 replication initiator protein A [Mesorhizobium sp. BR1-1-16]